MAADRSGGLILAQLIFLPRLISNAYISIPNVTLYNFMKFCNITLALYGHITLPLYAHMRIDAYNHIVIGRYR